MKSRYKFLAAIDLTLCFWHPAAVLARIRKPVKIRNQINPQPATEHQSR
ncbi:hypothetical protein ACXO17_06155 [Lactobacillus delbrueckii subsp. bulgaricus]